jgi:hypothetical protein
MNFLEQLRERKENANGRTAFPLVLYLSLVLKFSETSQDSDAHWTVPYWLFEYLKPLEDTLQIKERRLSVLEGNGLTGAISRLSGISESVIIDTERSMEWT